MLHIGNRPAAGGRTGQRILLYIQHSHLFNGINPQLSKLSCTLQVVVFGLLTVCREF